MPEGKITRQRVKDHFRRLWLVYLVGAVVLCFLNHLVFTVTRPGYSEAETLKIMLLNAEVSLPEEELLEKTQHLGFRTVETGQLSVVPEDATSRMLMITQLVSGDGDIYIADAVGVSVLEERGVCRSMRALRDGLYIAVISNEQKVHDALEILINELESMK